MFMTAVIVVMAIMALGFVFAALWVDRPHPFQCETCGRWLTDSQAVILSEEWTDELGGSSIQAVFCKRDVPA